MDLLILWNLFLSKTIENCVFIFVFLLKMDPFLIYYMLKVSLPFILPSSFLSPLPKRTTPFLSLIIKEKVSGDYNQTWQN